MHRLIYKCLAALKPAKPDFLHKEHQPQQHREQWPHYNEDEGIDLVIRQTGKIRNVDYKICAVYENEFTYSF
jgi:hypothetical protein